MRAVNDCGHGGRTIFSQGIYNITKSVQNNQTPRNTTPLTIFTTGRWHGTSLTLMSTYMDTFPWVRTSRTTTRKIGRKDPTWQLSSKFKPDIEYWLNPENTYRVVFIQNQASWFVITGHDFTVDAHNEGGIIGNGQVSNLTHPNLKNPKNHQRKNTHFKLRTHHSYSPFLLPKLSLGGNTSNLTHAPTVTVVHSRSHYHTSNEPRFGISTLTHHRFGVIPSRTLWMWCTMVWSATLRMGMKRLLVWSMCLLQWFFLRALAFFFSFSLLAFCFGESGD